LSNEEGIIQQMYGGVIEIHANEGVSVGAVGLTVFGTDDHNTVTFVPWANVLFVRTYTKTARRRELDALAEKHAQEHTASQEELARQDAERIVEQMQDDGLLGPSTTTE